MNILYVYADVPEEWNCAEWRCQIPHDAINRLPDHKARMIFIADWIDDKENSEWADIIIVQRNMFAGVLATTFYWRAQGKPVVLDLDDAYSYMPANIITYNFWRMGLQNIKDKTYKLSYIPYEHLQHSTQILSAITVASPILYNDWANKVESYHVPNYPEVKRYEPYYIKKEEFNSPIVIGWGGSSTHLDSFKDSSVIPALRRISERHKVTIKIVSNDKRILTAMRMRNVEHAPFVHFTKWPEEIAKFDIGIAPLSGLYDQRRSTIKVLENMIMGVPTIATNYEAYSEFKDYVRLVDNSTKYWEEALEDTIKFKDIAQIEKAREFAMSYDINMNIHKTLETYQKIITKRRNLL